MNKLLTKSSLVFPGVGSQHPLMCKSFYDNSRIAKDTFEEASDVLKMNMENICFSKDYAKELNKIDVSQMALVTGSMAVFRVFEHELGFEPDYLLGHSLGEYSALCASGAIEFADALNLVKQRGQIIKEVSSKVEGTMMWVINLENEIVESVCEEFAEDGQRVYISAYDSPTQCSISGKKDAVIKVAKELEQKGAIVYPLKMAGPYHSPLMEDAAVEMRGILSNYKFRNPKYKVIANCSALPYSGENQIIDNLSRQLKSPVKWQESIKYIQNEKVKLAIEIGPKDVLKFLIKKNTPDINTFSFNKYEQIGKIRKDFVIGEEDGLTIIGNCLKAAVSVKNQNSDPGSYYNEVLMPYKEIEALYEEVDLKGKTVDRKHIEMAIKMVRNVFEGKKVPKEIRQNKLEQIFDGKVLRMEI